MQSRRFQRVRIDQHGVSDAGDAAPEGRIGDVAQAQRERAIAAVPLRPAGRPGKPHARRTQKGRAFPAAGCRGQRQGDARVAAGQVIRFKKRQRNRTCKRLVRKLGLS